MKRRLVWLNLALLMATGACCWTLYERYRAAEQRNAEVLARASRGLAIEAIEQRAAEDPPLRAASYFEVAEKLLFSKDRNPTVVVEAPQEKPMPPLPNLYGVMDIGSGPVAFLARKGEGQRGYRLGESIGDFKLVAATPEELTFEWDGKQVKRRPDQLRPDPKDIAQQPAAPAASQAPVGAPSAPAEPKVAGRPAEPKLGADIGPTSKYCVDGDTSPEGTELDGYRKVLRRTPFSTSCIWEKIQ